MKRYVFLLVVLNYIAVISAFFGLYLLQDKVPWANSLFITALPISVFTSVASLWALSIWMRIECILFLDRHTVVRDSNTDN